MIDANNTAGKQFPLRGNTVVAYRVHLEAHKCNPIRPSATHE